MPITFDITQDLRYRQGMERGIEKGVQNAKKEDARKMLEEGLSLALIQKITGLSVSQIQELSGKLSS